MEAKKKKERRERQTERNSFFFFGMFVDINPSVCYAKALDEWIFIEIKEMAELYN